jgi:hypothetical protein
LSQVAGDLVKTAQEAALEHGHIPAVPSRVPGPSAMADPQTSSP